jgi:hypothetical protein
MVGWRSKTSLSNHTVMLEIQIKYNNVIKWLIDGELIKVVTNLYISWLYVLLFFLIITTLFLFLFFTMTLEVQGRWLNDPCIILYLIILEYFPIQMMLASQSLHRKDVFCFVLFSLLFLFINISKITWRSFKWWTTLLS